MRSADPTSSPSSHPSSAPTSCIPRDGERAGRGWRGGRNADGGRACTFGSVSMLISPAASDGPASGGTIWKRMTLSRHLGRLSSTYCISEMMSLCKGSAHLGGRPVLRNRTFEAQAHQPVLPCSFLFTRRSTASRVKHQGDLACLARDFYCGFDIGSRPGRRVRASKG
jgi:hypothetical protein